MLGCFETLRQACTSEDNLFVALANLLLEGVNSGALDKGKSEAAGRSYSARNNERIDQSLRFTRQLRNMATWMEIEQAWQQAAHRLQAGIFVVTVLQKSNLNTHNSRPPYTPGT